MAVLGIRLKIGDHLAHLASIVSSFDNQPIRPSNLFSAARSHLIPTFWMELVRMLDTCLMVMVVRQRESFVLSMCLGLVVQCLLKVKNKVSFAFLLSIPFSKVRVSTPCIAY